MQNENTLLSHLLFFSIKYQNVQCASAKVCMGGLIVRENGGITSLK